MDDDKSLSEIFEQQRPRLRGVAYRMLGSLSEADDAVQEAWLRLSRADHAEIDELGAWLTTTVARIALNMLRARKTRSETRMPDPIVDGPGGPSPEHEVLLANTVGLALQVVLETLSPAERVAFVLHDVFSTPFETIAPILDRTPEATRQLASRARRRVQASHPSPDADRAAETSVVEAFRVAAASGDVLGLLAVLAPDVVLRADRGAVGGALVELRGAERVARGAAAFSRLDLLRQPALINGAPGLVCLLGDEPFAVMAFVVRGSKITEIDILRDPARLGRLDLGALPH